MQYALVVGLAEMELSCVRSVIIFALTKMKGMVSNEICGVRHSFLSTALGLCPIRPR